MNGKKSYQDLAGILGLEDGKFMGDSKPQTGESCPTRRLGKITGAFGRTIFLHHYPTNGILSELWHRLSNGHIRWTCHVSLPSTGRHLFQGITLISFLAILPPFSPGLPFLQAPQVVLLLQPRLSRRRLPA